MITTKTGDLGQTTCGNKRLDKDNALVEAIGEMDELQAILELVGVEEKIIDDLRQIMGELSCDIKFVDFDLRIKEMEKEIEEMEKELPKFDKFLKFNNKEALNFNWARTVCRRVERRVVALDKAQKINKNNLIYFNRLSDYLFLKAIRVN